jgi:DNA-binding NarL/FixJ family response regulator
MMTQALGNLMFSIGRLGEAAELLDRAVESARLSGNPVPLTWALLNRAYTALLAGEHDRALVLSQEAMTVARPLGRTVVGMWAADVHAAVLLEHGDPAAAAELLVDRCGGEAVTLVPGGLRSNSLEVLTRARLAAGRRADAERAAAAARAHADAFGLPMARAFADRAAAILALDAGAADDAVACALASAAAAEEVGAPVEAAISRTLAGRALASLGHPEAAAAELERAAAELEACGALRRRDEAERELRRLGRVVHRRTQPGRSDAQGPASLTGRELEVARLVVDRRTNPEIAAELFLSIKTVETHLRNIFRKLDAASRVEVARIMERERSVPS